MNSNIQVDQDGCLIIVCKNCDFVNVLQVDETTGKLCADEETCCWSCGEEIIEKYDDDPEKYVE